MKKDSGLKTFLIIASFCILLFGLSLPVLLLLPKAVEVAETQISFLGNQINPLPQVLGEEISKEDSPKINIVNTGVNPPLFSSNVVYAQDFETGEILYSKNADKRVAPASTTKIMTALVAQEYFRPADVLTVPKEARVGGSTMGLKVGERLTFRSLLYGMLLNSGNDAAYTIALNYPGGVSAFVSKMNEKALHLGLKDTHFTNPAGFDHPNHYSSAADLAVIAKQAALNPQLARVVATQETSILSIDKTHSHILRNLNKLLGEEGVLGIKTGTTEMAGENLVALFDRNNRKVLTVVLGSSNRFGETKSLTNWIYSNYLWQIN